MVYLYRNLRTRRWQVSDKPKSGGTQHDVIAMRGVTFRISEAVRQWCLAHAMPSGKPYRQVHAYAVGELCEVSSLPSEPRVQISYNLARAGYFYRVDTGAAVSRCEYVLFDQAGAWAINPD